MANKTIEELKSEAAVVRDATEEGENTATRVGTVLIDMIDSLSNATVNGIKGYMVIDSTSELPTNPTSDQQMIGYLLDTTLYVYVGTGGDTLDGKYQSAELKGADGAPGAPGPKGDSGVDLGEVVLVDDITTGGRESALTAEQGKVLNNKIFHKVPINIGTITSNKAIRVDGNVYDSSNLHSISDYIDVTGYSEFFISCALWVSTTASACTIVGFYNASKQLVGMLHPSMFTTSEGLGVTITDQYVATNSDVVKYVRFSNYNNAPMALYGVDNKMNNVAKTKQLGSGWVKSGVSNSRKALLIYPRLLVANGAKLKFSAKVKSSNTSIALAGFSEVKHTYNSGDAPDLYDSTWQTEFDNFELPINYPYETIQFRLKDESLSANATDAQINALLDYLYISFESPLLGGDTLVQFDLLKSLINGDEVMIYSQGLNPAVNSVNHRGYNTIAPENTMPAFRLSLQKGFAQMETDIQFTSDDVAVLLHDATINRTARNADGSAISGTVYIRNITYAQSQTYDFGIWKSADYEGTKIPTLQEFLLFCRASGVHPYLELKSEITTTQAESVVAIVNSCGMRGKVTYISFSVPLLTAVKDVDSKARLGYLVQGTLSASHITTAQGLQTGDNEVFIDGNSTNATSVSLCKGAKIPYEVWTINSTATILALDPFITGVTSDSLIASKVLFDNLNI